MAKIWVLDTDTKGTGAEMVPLEKVLRKPDPKPEPRFVASAPEPRAEREPEPKPPASFRVIDVMTREVLAERAGTRETVELLEGTRSVVDVNIEVWNPEAKIWHRLTHGERKVLWELRGRRGRGARSQASGRALRDQLAAAHPRASPRAGRRRAAPPVVSSAGGPNVRP